MDTFLYKELPVSVEIIKEAVEKHATPFHIYDENKIRENARALTTEFRAYFPEYKNYFAVKATPNPHIMKILKEEGMGMDCSSLAELMLSEKGMPT